VRNELKPNAWSHHWMEWLGWKFSGAWRGAPGDVPVVVCAQVVSGEW